MPSLPHGFVHQPVCRHRVVLYKSSDAHSGLRNVELYNPNCPLRVTAPCRSVIVLYPHHCRLQPSKSLVQTPARPTIAMRWLSYCSCTAVDDDDLRAAGRGGDADPLLCCLLWALTPLVGGESFAMVRRMKIGKATQGQLGHRHSTMTTA